MKRILKKTKSGDYFCKFTAEDVDDNELSPGNYKGIITKFSICEASDEDKTDLLWLTIELSDGTSVDKPIFINTNSNSVFRQLLFVSGYELNKKFLFKNLVDTEVGFRLVQKKDYLNIIEFFDPNELEDSVEN